MSIGDGWKGGGAAGQLAGQAVSEGTLVLTGGDPTSFATPKLRFPLAGGADLYHMTLGGIASNTWEFAIGYYTGALEPVISTRAASLAFSLPSGSGLIAFGGNNLNDLGGASNAWRTLYLSAASGSDSIKVLTNGSRVHFGSGASDYASSDGTTVTFAGPIATASSMLATSYNASSASGYTGTLYVAPSGSTATLSGQVADGSTSVGVKIGTGFNSYTTAGAKLVSVINNGVEKASVDYLGNVSSVATAVGTPASGGTIVTGYNGDHRRAAFKITVGFADWTAGALFKDITLGVIPAKTRVVSCIADTTIAYAGTAGTIAITVGKTAGGAEYIASHDVKSAAVVKGLADADMGTLLTRAAAIQGGDMAAAMWTGTTNYQARITSSSGNVSGFNAGSTTFYLVVEFFA